MAGTKGHMAGCMATNAEKFTRTLGGFCFGSVASSYGSIFSSSGPGIIALKLQIPGMCPGLCQLLAQGIVFTRSRLQLQLCQR